MTCTVFSINFPYRFLSFLLDLLISVTCHKLIQFFYLTAIFSREEYDMALAQWQNIATKFSLSLPMGQMCATLNGILEILSVTVVVVYSCQSWFINILSYTYRTNYWKLRCNVLSLTDLFSLFRLCMDISCSLLHASSQCISSRRLEFAIL